MPALSILFLLTPIAACVQPDSTFRPPEAVATYGIAVKATIGALPEKLRSQLSPDISMIVQHAEGGFRDEAEAHYVFLDVGANEKNADRLGGGSEFPRDRSAAEKLFRESGLNGGLLPWLLIEKQVALRAAFESKSDEAFKAIGEIVHLSVDACMPFHLTRRAKDIHGEVARAFEEDLPAKAHPRLEFEVRLSPERFTRVLNVSEMIFGEASRAFRDGDKLLELFPMRGSTAEKNKDLASQLRAGEIWAEAIPVLEERIESGALLAANLIGSAWLDAGSPEFAAKKRETAIASSKGVATEGGAFLGSANSKTFHRANCVHAARIKVENRVSFANCGQAKSAGRQPCKACKPE